MTAVVIGALIAALAAIGLVTGEDDDDQEQASSGPSIEASGPDDEYYDSKVKVLSEMIKHHVKEEEKPGGMFTGARKSDMDLDALGQRLKARKEQLADRKLDA